MKSKTAPVVTSDAEIDAAISRAAVYDRYRPKAVAATYRPRGDVIAIKLATGVELAVPRKLMQGLENATARQLAEVEIDDYGSALHWESLDVDHSLRGLIDGVFGTRAWMGAIGTAGGSSRSNAKRAASRKNGRKGGRPRKRAAA